MVRIVKTEFYKLKRYHILWAGVALMLLSVLLTLFTSMANDGSVWDFAYLTEQVIKNNMSMIFPMCISLIAGYMISREQTDDTLKNILTVPISFKKLLTGKLIVCGVLSIIFGLICSLFTIIAEMIVGFPGFETVAFWTLYPEPAPYLCVEPWNGSGIYENEDDQLSHRHHIQHLLPGDSRSYVMTIRILERFSEQ